MPGLSDPAPHGNFSRWEMGPMSMWLNFSNPTILNVNQTPKYPWANESIVIQHEAQVEDWVYLLITSTGFPFGKSPNRNFVPAAHPVSLSTSLCTRI